MATNPALQDIEAIIDTKPELTIEEWQIVEKASDWVKTMLRPEVRTELEAEYAQKQREFQETLRTETQALIANNMDEWRKSQEPLGPDDLAKLLNQEYVEFPLKLKIKGEETKRTFTICELPQEAEIKFVKIIQKNIIPLVQQVNAAEWTLDGSILEQIQGIMQNLPTALDFAAELTAICLDPWGEDTSIDKVWVTKNISVYRIGAIVAAQFEANKYRDFFSGGFRAFQSLKKKN